MNIGTKQLVYISNRGAPSFLGDGVQRSLLLWQLPSLTLSPQHMTALMVAPVSSCSAKVFGAVPQLDSDCGCVVMGKFRGLVWS